MDSSSFTPTGPRLSLSQLIFCAGLFGIWISALDQVFYLREAHPEIERTLVIFTCESISAVILLIFFTLTLHGIGALVARFLRRSWKPTMTLALTLIWVSLSMAMLYNEYSIARLPYFIFLCTSLLLLGTIVATLGRSAKLTIGRSAFSLASALLATSLFTDVFVYSTKGGLGAGWRTAFVAHLILLPIFWLAISLVTAKGKTLLSAIPALIMLAVATGQWIKLRPQTRPAGDRPNIVLIIMDAMRRDHLSLYSPEGVTPEIDKFFRDGTIFLDAYSASSWTLPSMTAMFSSRFPAYDFRKVRYRYTVARDVETLAETLAKQGYATGAFCGNQLLGTFSGMTRGFDEQMLLGHYDRRDEIVRCPKLVSVIYNKFSRRLHPDDRIADTTGMILERSLQFLRRHKEENFFLWIHLMSPHDPYDPEHVEDGYKGPLRKDRFQPALEFPSKEDINEGRYRATKEDQTHLSHLYREEVAMTDQALGSFFDDISSMGVPQNTIFVLAADHGEEFWDHGQYGHGQSLHAELTHVPYLFRIPGMKGRSIEGAVSTIDTMPTLKELLGIEEKGNIDGRSLKPAIESGQNADRQACSFEYNRGFLAMRSGEFSANWNFVTGEKWLYNRVADPKELENIAESNSEIMENFVRQMDEIRNKIIERTPKSQATDPGDAQTLRDMRAFGYLQ